MAPGTVVLGKRKRRVPADKAADLDAKTDEAAALEEAQAIFRKHFEAQFAPLEGSDDEEPGRPAAKGRRRKAAAEKGADGDEGGAAGVEDMRSETSDSGADDDSQDEWDGLSAEDDGDSDSQGGWWPKLRPQLMKQAFSFSLLLHPSVVVLTHAGHRQRGQ